MYYGPMIQRRIAPLTFAAAMLALVLCLPAPARAEQKLGYVNPQRVVNETRLGQTAKADLARYVQDKERMARESAAQLTALRKEADAATGQDRARREDALRRKAAQHEALLAENAREIRAEETRLLHYVMRRAESVLEEIGKKGGYSLILIDPNVVGYVDKASVDITDGVVRELESRTK